MLQHQSPIQTHVLLRVFVVSNLACAGSPGARASSPSSLLASLGVASISRGSCSGGAAGHTVEKRCSVRHVVPLYPLLAPFPIVGANVLRNLLSDPPRDDGGEGEVPDLGDPLVLELRQLLPFVVRLAVCLFSRARIIFLTAAMRTSRPCGAGLLQHPEVSSNRPKKKQ